MPTDPVDTCPECAGPLKAGSFVLCRREDDGKRTCRIVWVCSHRHVWWKWADRPDAALEPCPHPGLFGG
jgi:hypothetical protein